MARGKRGKAKVPAAKSSSEAPQTVQEDRTDGSDVTEKVQPTQEASNKSVSASVSVTNENVPENGQQLMSQESTHDESDEEGDLVWTSEREDRLIDLYKECTFLYDKNVPAFQQRHKKEMAHARFAELLGVTGMLYMHYVICVFM